MNDSAALLKITSDWIACPSCDLLSDLSRLSSGDKAQCPRCGHFLTSLQADALVRVSAFSVTALVFLLIACSFPFLSFKASGLESMMTLPQTALKLYDQGMPELALLVAGFIILIPTAITLLVAIISSCLVQQRYFPWLVPITRSIFVLQTWSMAEVFFIGVLVSLVKISHMATVVIGISFWAYAAFFLFFTLALANLDRHQCWREIERLEVQDA